LFFFCLFLLTLLLFLVVNGEGWFMGRNFWRLLVVF
jgi:hypothetical protein